MFHLHLSDAMTGRPGSGIASNPKSSSIPFKTGSVPAAMWQVVATCMLFLSFVAGCSHIFSPNEMGEIYVQSPAVYTRERVLNDRNDHAAWLQKVLDETKGTADFGIQGNAQRSALSALFASSQVTIDRAQQIEALLKKPPENNSSQSNTALTDVISKLQNVTPLSTLPNNVTASPLDTFRDRLALREEIRLERIQTELDDRHDLNGNTLYRFTFDTMVRPAKEDVNAWAVVRARFDASDNEEHYPGLYEEWRQHLEKQLSQIHTGILAMLTRPDRDEHYYGLAAYLNCELQYPNAEVDPLSCLPRSQTSSSHLSSPSLQNPLANLESDSIFHSQGLLHKVLLRKEDLVVPSQGLRIQGETKQQVGNEPGLRPQDSRTQKEIPSPSTPSSSAPGAVTLPHPIFAAIDRLKALQKKDFQLAINAAACDSTREVKEMAEREGRAKTKAETSAFKAQEAAQREFHLRRMALIQEEETRNLEKLRADLEKTAAGAEAALSKVNPKNKRAVEAAQKTSQEAAKNAASARMELELSKDRTAKAHRDLEIAHSKSMQAEENANADLELAMAQSTIRTSFEQYDRENLIENCQEQALLRWLIKKYLVFLYGNEFDLKKFYDVTINPIPPSLITLKKTPHKFLEFKTALINKVDESLIYSYAVTPKESVQRISDATSSRDAKEFLGSLSALTGTVGLNMALATLNRNDAAFNAIRRKPLVVGFGDIRGTRERSQKQSSLPGTHQIGWVIGPKFNLTSPKDGDRLQLSFAHTAIQNSLSASVSLPAWLKEVTVKINRCWLDAEDSRHMSEIEDQDNDETAMDEPIDYSCRDASFANPRVQYFNVDLPGDVTALDSTLLKAPRKPIVTVGQPKAVEFIVNKSGALLIPGQNLWRATVVTIGPWKADRIIVLPNMEGIIAEFDKANTENWTKTKENDGAPIYVWTSEGVAEAGTAVILADAEISLRVSYPKPRYIVGDEFAVLISDATLPKGFFELNLAIRRRGTTSWGNAVKGQLKGNTLTGTIPPGNPCGAIAPCTSGDLIDVGIALKLTENGEPKFFIAKEQPVFYLKPEDAKVRLQKPDGTTGPAAIAKLDPATKTTIKATYPTNVTSAYSGFDPELAKIRAKGPDQKAPTLTILKEQCTLSAGQIICEYKVSGPTYDKPPLNYSLEFDGSGDKPAIADPLVIGQ